MRQSETKSRTIHVGALTRVEGEGALRIEWGAGGVERVELNIYEPPRFFESFLRGRPVEEVPDIVARICGICPVAYQMSACHALEKAVGAEITPEIRALRRLLYCGEWIESHSLHVHLLHAPDFLGYESGMALAADQRDIVERGLRMKEIGNRLLEILGGRAIHPINVTVGGFYRSPSVRRLNELLPELEWGLAAARETVDWVARFAFPEFESTGLMVSLLHADEYPMNEGVIAASDGMRIDMESYLERFAERHVAHSTALHSVRMPEGEHYLVGPLARMNLAWQQLPPTAKACAVACGTSWPCRNNYRSIVARAVEMVAAFEEAIRIVSSYRSELTPACVALPRRRGEGRHATEAPRGLLFHRYRVEDGCIAEATIVPPTSQNQGSIEADLRRLAEEIETEPLDRATQRCEHLIRNYDPCISCATHFLRLERVPAAARRTGGAVGQRPEHERRESES